MNQQELTEKIHTLSKYLRDQTDHSERERILIQTMKIAEEVGELTEAILQETGGQMRSKAHKELAIGPEIADVIICTLLVADMLGVAVWDEIDTKLEAVFKRMQ
jgi:NTP pyrophosphatase (non-canonical NTP hydrolase)